MLGESEGQRTLQVAAPYWCSLSVGDSNYADAKIQVQA